MTNKEIIAVVTAAEAGKQIQIRSYFAHNSVHYSEAYWKDEPSPTWNFCDFDYRIKPEPREIWLVEGIPFVCKHEALAFTEARGCPPPVHYREVV